MTITLNGTTGISNDGGYTGDGVSFADTTPANTLVTTTGGNVGIGTSSPAQKLHVASAGTTAIQVQNTISSGGSYFKSTNTATTCNFGVDAIGGFIETLGAYGTLFYTNGSERMRIDSSGSLLVGTTATNPISSRVNGVRIGGSGGTLVIRQASNTSDWGLNSTSGSIVNFYSDNGSNFVYAGNIGVNGNTTSYTSASDYRLKENVQPMTGALAKVQALKPVTFTFKEGNQVSQGFIAHELAEVCPDAVSGEKDAVDAEGNPVYQGIDTSFLVATLTAAIQELKAELDTVKAEVTALKGTA